MYKSTEFNLAPSEHDDRYEAAQTHADRVLEQMENISAVVAGRSTQALKLADEIADEMVEINRHSIGNLVQNMVRADRAVIADKREALGTAYSAIEDAIASLAERQIGIRDAYDAKEGSA